MVRLPDVISGRKGFLDDLQLMVDAGLQLKNHAALAVSLGLEHYVPLTTTVDIGYRVTGVQILDGY